MRRFADLTEDEAIEFWGENIAKFESLYKNPEFIKAVKESEDMSNDESFKLLVKYNKDTIKELIKWVDPSPITVSNFMPRVVDLFSAMNDDFFTSPSTEEQTPST